MKPDLIKDFKLPSYIKGKSFAEAAKSINKKFEDREDPNSEQTKKELLDRLAKAQEYVKMQESLRANSQEVPDMMNGQIPQEMQQFAYGGYSGPGDGSLGKKEIEDISQTTDIDFDSSGANALFSRTSTDASGTTPRVDFGKYAEAGYFTQGNSLGGNRVAIHNTDKNPHNASTIRQTVDYLRELNPGVELDMQYRQRGQNQKELGGYIDAANTALDIGQGVFGNTGIDTSGTNRMEAQSAEMGAASGAVKGASAGASFGPWGAAIGGVVGGVGGLLGANRVNKDILENNRNNDAKANFQHTNNFAGGGWLGNIFGKRKNQIDYQGIQDTFNDPNTYDSTKIDASIGGGNNTIKQQQSDPSNFKSTAGKALSWVGDNYGNILRTAPIVGNALALKNLDKPSPVRLDRLDGRYKENRVDERALQNRVENEASNISRGLANASGGSAGSLRANLLGASLNKTNALSNAYLQAEQLNAQESARAQQFNAQQDAMNLRQNTMEQDINAQNEGAYNSIKANLQSQIATDIGNIGREQVNMKQVAEMFGYTWDGKYIRDKEGNIVNPFTLQQEAKKAQE